MATKSKSSSTPDAQEVAEILAALKKDSYARSTTKCRVGQAIEKTEEPHKTVLLTAMPDDDIGTAGLSRYLSKLGYAIHESTIANHRKGRCACARHS